MSGRKQRNRREVPLLERMVLLEGTTPPLILWKLDLKQEITEY